MSDRVQIRRALLGVSDKTGLIELARALIAAGVEIVSTGGTAAAITDAGLPVTAVSDVTGFPEMLDGRVKTLHPAIHGGLLGRPADPGHIQAMSEHGIAPFQLLVVNLYPFASTVASGASVDDCIENIDIGGPAMVRAAAKNHESVAVVTSPEDYALVAAALTDGGFTFAERQRLAARAFAHTASYDTAVAQWFAQQADQVEGWPMFSGITAQLAQPLRYGENPHQSAALYVDSDASNTGVARGILLQGKEMSYNNYIDADAAWRAAHDHGDIATVAIIKHANPCGIAIAEDVRTAYRKAFDCDSLSAFGGVVALNRPLDAATASAIAEVFTEVVIAPEFTEQARAILADKTALRLLQAQPPSRSRMEWRAVSGGHLRQQPDALDAAGDSAADWSLACGDAADVATLRDLEFAWRACRAVKSNAILLASEGASVGVGMGQVNRVDSARLAVARAGERAVGAVAASDAFFPFADGLQVLIDAGVRAVVQPGGSKRDAEVIAAAREAGITMYLTGTRHFAH
jgi:phosphoribosylaminoimidazolecarboxamide formyltransferase/IMP cyclohydrolase